jgi:membrane fusion protein
VELRAPVDGTVTAVLAEVGQSVSAAAAVAALLPTGALLQAELFAPSSAIGLLQVGQSVRMRFDAYPYQRFGHRDGQVLQVSRTPLAAAELAALALPALGGAEPMFRVRVAIADLADGPALGPGMRLQSDVQLERRRLIEWLFAPAFGLTDRW